MEHRSSGGQKKAMCTDVSVIKAHRLPASPTYHSALYPLLRTPMCPCLTDRHMDHWWCWVSLPLCYSTHQPLPQANIGFSALPQHYSPTFWGQTHRHFSFHFRAGASFIYLIICSVFQSTTTNFVDDIVTTLSQVVRERPVARTQYTKPSVVYVKHCMLGRKRERLHIF